MIKQSLVGSPAPGCCFPRPVVHGARSVVIDRHRPVAFGAAAIPDQRTCYAMRRFAQAAHGPPDPRPALGGAGPFGGAAPFGGAGRFGRFDWPGGGGASTTAVLRNQDA